MPFSIVYGDITAQKTDAIVNAANTALQQGGGVCGAIFAAAGARELQAACDRIGRCETGQAVLTEGFRLPARYIIHAVGPVWRGGKQNEETLLASCYRSALLLAHKQQCRSIAFPLISSGIYGYPKEEALRVARQSIEAFLQDTAPEMEAVLVLFGKPAGGEAAV